MTRLFIKGAVCAFAAIVLGSCFDPPQFPVVPRIEYQKVEFYDNASGVDSLVLYLTFQDGDGDLGIDETSYDFLGDPYNNLIFYQTDSSDPQHLIPLNTLARTTGKDTLNILEIDDPTKGKLAFPRTRKQPGFEYLPPYRCQEWEFLRNTKLLVQENDLAVLDDKVTFIDTLYQLQQAGPPLKYYMIRDTLYYTINPNHYNIEVDFLVKNPADPKADEDGYVEFDWHEFACGQTYDGRFPVLSDNPGSALEGTLRYSMKSVGFKNLFSINTMKLRVSIKDRALNKSNVVESQPFTLDGI